MATQNSVVLHLPVIVLWYRVCRCCRTGVQDSQYTTRCAPPACTITFTEMGVLDSQSTGPQLHHQPALSPSLKWESWTPNPTECHPPHQDGSVLQQPHQPLTEMGVLDSHFCKAQYTTCVDSNSVSSYPIRMKPSAIER